MSTDWREFDYSVAGTKCCVMAQFRLSSNLSRGNNQDGDLVSSKCIQTLDGHRYVIQSYIAGDRLRSIEKRIKKLAVGSANFSVVYRRRC